MAASVEMDDSTSEDEETLAKLREAAIDSSALTKSSSCSTGKTHCDKVQNIVEHASLRPDKQKVTADPFNAMIETTPGIRKHIAKKLASALDNEIDSSERCFCPASEHVSSESTGVKLLYQSERYLTTVAEEEELPSKPKRKRPPSPSSDDSSEEEKLKEAAVSHGFVISQSYQPFYSDNKPPDVTVIANGNTSQQEASSDNLHIKQYKKAKDSSVDDSEIVKSFESGSSKDSLPKKKKKKKHKNRKSGEEG